MQVQIPAWHRPVFFSFIAFLPFGFLLFILTADPVSFAIFLRKRISSNYGLLVKTIKKFPKSPFRPAGRVLTFDRHQICSAINRVTIYAST